MKYFEREGKISSADIIMEDHGFLVFAIGFRLEHSHVGSYEAKIPINWIEESKPQAFPTYTQGFLKDILRVLKKAKVDAISELVGKKVICRHDGMELKSWKLAKNEQ